MQIQNAKTQRIIIALAMALLMTSAAMAQGVGGDIIGATPVKDAFIAVCKIIAFGGIGWGFIRLVGGRHTMEGLVTMAAGGLGVAKVDAIAGLFGL